MGGWEDGHGRHLSNHEETDRASERGRERGDGGSDLAVASGVADRQSVGLRGRHRRRGSHTGEVHIADPDRRSEGGGADDGWGN